MKRNAKSRTKPTHQQPPQNESKFQQLLHRYWTPKPIRTPTVDPELRNLSGIERVAESLRYTVLSIEWWLSPNGTLREWLKINGKVSSILLIPAVLVIPLVTFIVWQLATWIVLLVQIASNLILLPLAALAAGILITGVVLIVRTVLGK